jgi:hypothetical protein
MSTTVNIIQGIKPGTIKIIGYKGVGITGYSPVALVAIVYADWFLPSQFELIAIYNELKVFGVGLFTSNQYWTSTESINIRAVEVDFSSGIAGATTKDQILYIRACRAFTSTHSYSLRDIGPAGGLIFYKSGNNYIEAAPSDQSTGKTWSNIIDQAIGATARGTAIGTGQSNTTAIIGQAGHTDSAAKLCDDLIITR